jgi:hypothetical protein
VKSSPPTAGVRARATYFEGFGYSSGMRTRYWALVIGGPLGLWSCSDTCGVHCGDCKPAPGDTGCAPPTEGQTTGMLTSTEPDDSSTRGGNSPSTVENESEQSSSETSIGDQSTASDDLDSTTSGESDTGPEGTKPGGTTSDAPTATDESSSKPVVSEDTDTTDDESTPAAVNPEDGTSDASTRLKTVPVGASDAALGYWEYLPPTYDTTPAPLLVFTHGASWQGDGSETDLQELLTVGPVNLISEDKWPNSRPFVVLAPQNSHSGCFTAEDIDGFYQYALETYDIDTTRIYHTGQSCGAIGGWNYLAAHLDEHVTAAVLISGDGQDAFAQAGCDLGRVAIWGLHNEKDGSVNSGGTINPIMDLMLCDPVPDVKLTVYPDATEHDAWTKTYDLSSGNDIYSWLLQHTHP